MSGNTLTASSVDPSASTGPPTPANNENGTGNESNSKEIFCMVMPFGCLCLCFSNVDHGKLFAPP